jgi:hypothetical protein
VQRYASYGCKLPCGVMQCHAEPCHVPSVMLRWVTSREKQLPNRLRHFLPVVGGASQRILLGVANPLMPVPESVKEFPRKPVVLEATFSPISTVRDARRLVRQCATGANNRQNVSHPLSFSLLSKGCEYVAATAKTRRTHPSRIRLQVSR